MKLEIFFKKNTQFSLRCPDYNIFRLLKLGLLKNKKVLDIGYGDGENIIEFDRRGAITYGISLVDKTKYIKKSLKNFKTANFVHCNLNQKKLTECFQKKKELLKNTKNKLKVTERDVEREEKISPYEKFDVIISTDTIYYIDDLKMFFREVSKILKKDAFFLFQYIEDQYKTNFDNLNLKNLNLVGNIKKYKKYKKYYDKQNPIVFLKNKTIEKCILDSKLIYVNSIFNYHTYSDNKKNNFLHKNIYILLKKE